jgi:AcrR family transcriptional regulator
MIKRHPVSRLVIDREIHSSRRSPVQARSQETVQRLFRATSRLLMRMPLQEITTNLIAREAKLSIGAVYRFFPDKQAIIDAIAVRHLDEFRALLEVPLKEFDQVDGPRFLSTVIDTYVAFLDRKPDFRTIALGHYISNATRQRHAQPDVGGTGMVKRFMLKTLGTANHSHIDLQLRVAMETGERLIAYAYQQTSRAERSRIIAELKRLLSLYLFEA